jgi:quercetin dioxygenase-like cupin family protein
MRRILLLAAALVLAVSTAKAQDPVKVDPRHYKVAFENAQVRVLRIYYGPYEKSVMHSHPDGVAVFLMGQRAKFTFPDGKSEERSWKPGDARWTPAETHLPENPGEKPLQLVLVELKGKPAAKAPAAKAPAKKPTK